MKKSLILMLVLAAVLLAGCGSNEAVTERTGAEATSAKSEKSTTEKTPAEGTVSVEADEAAQSEREGLRDTEAQQAAEEFRQFQQPSGTVGGT
jgi:uncharacterized protein YcfL